MRSPGAFGCLSMSITQTPFLMTQLRFTLPASATIALTIGAMLFGPAPSAAQQGVGQASFTAAQAEAGAEVYRTSCAACHGPDLRGAFEAAELAGPSFRNNWGARPVTALMERIRGTMPPAAPGRLDQEAYAAVTAYILQRNGVSATAEPLTFASNGLAVRDPASGGQLSVASRAEDRPTDVIYPVPGRPGNTPSPEAVDRPPAVVGEVTETETGITRTFQRPTRFRPVSNRDLAGPPGRDWLHWRGGPHSLGYSPLAQINTETVGRLQLAWVWGMRDGTSQQAPLVRDGVLFLSNPGNLVQALDAATGTLLWEYERKFGQGRSQGQLRTLAIWEDLVFLATIDAHMVALDAESGVVRWETRIADPQQGYTNVSGPIIADGKVINGINGCQRLYSESCFITAHDARTGRELWRTYTIARPGEPGGDSWGGLPFELRGGGDVWISGSYDPDLGLVFFGTAQAKPWVAASRSLTTADSTLYANSTLALDAETGRIEWYRVHAPGESLDLDVAFEQVLLDLDGRPYLVTAGKDGILWKLDRRTGEFVGLKELVYQDIYEEVNPRTGALRYRQDIREAKVGDWLSVCPSTTGGHNWPAMAFHPETRILVVPLFQACMDMSGREAVIEPGGGGNEGDRRWKPMPGTDGQIGRLTAINAETFEEVWTVEQRAPFLTGALATAGGVVFVGDYDRRIRAFDIESGGVLWESRLATPVMGFPITFEVDGIQYLAVAAARGGGSPWRAGQFLAPELQSPEGANALYVFRLENR